MPFFDYVCETCGAEKEAMVKYYDDEVACECGDTMQRQIGTPAFVLKGAGFYSKGSSPKLDKDYMRLSDAEMNKADGINI